MSGTSIDTAMNSNKRPASRGDIDDTPPSKPRKKLFDSIPVPVSSVQTSKKKAPSFRCTPLTDDMMCSTNDEVHSSIKMCPVVRALVDTPAFQRLRGLKQLALADRVFMNCNHSRFEHSLGVAHLAEKLAKSVQEKQPRLQTTSKDVLCVKLAGLLHDIGHGPFSHQYELFVKSRLPSYLEKHPHLKQYYQHVPDLPKGWRHETVSLLMIDNLLESLGLAIDLQRLDEPLQQIGDGREAKTMRDFSQDGNDDNAILTSRDFLFIKECIWGGPIPDVEEQLGIKDELIGRTEPHKEWLYDIVTNRHSGLDVDKMDYFARDERRAKRGSGEIEKRLIEEAWVSWTDCLEKGGCKKCTNGRHLLLCYPEKMAPVCLNFFKKRYELHSMIYQHKAVVAAGYLVLDILCRADPFYRINVSKFRPATAQTAKYTELPISRAMLDPYAFLALNDTIVDIIANSTDDRLEGAQRLIHEHYRCRKLYKSAGMFPVDMQNPRERGIWEQEVENDQIEQDMFHLKGNYRNPDNGALIELESSDEIIVDRFSIHHGSKDKNPLDNIRFFTKGELAMMKGPIENLPVTKKPRPRAIAYDLPTFFQKNTFRIFTRDESKSALAEHIFGVWFAAKKDDFEQTMLEEDGSGEPVMLTQESVNSSDSEDNGMCLSRSPLKPPDRKAKDY